jgi:dTDP-4-dehydrorhamnose 3,5-epimerase
MTIEIVSTPLPDIVLFKPKIFEDERGFFFESYNKQVCKDELAIKEDFVQDNHSGSSMNVLRGLHYQVKNAQGKLLRVISGEIFDVVVDLRKSSSTFGRWAGIPMKASDRQMLWIPKGFAHGFLVLSDYAEVLYKATAFYDPASERCLHWNDPDLSITWPLKTKPIVSIKDQKGLSLVAADTFS